MSAGSRPQRDATFPDWKLFCRNSEPTFMVIGDDCMLRGRNRTDLFTPGHNSQSLENKACATAYLRVTQHDCSESG